MEVESKAIPKEGEPVFFLEELNEVMLNEGNKSRDESQVRRGGKGDRWAQYTDVQGQLGGDSSWRLPLSRGVLTAISPDFRAEHTG